MAIRISKKDCCHPCHFARLVPAPCAPAVAAATRGAVRDARVQRVQAARAPLLIGPNNCACASRGAHAGCVRSVAVMSGEEYLIQYVQQVASGIPTTISRTKFDGTETHDLTKVFPVLLRAWPERLVGGGWPADTIVPGGNPSWLSPGTFCLLARLRAACPFSPPRL